MKFDQKHQSNIQPTLLDPLTPQSSDYQDHLEGRSIDEQRAILSPDNGGYEAQRAALSPAPEPVVAAQVTDSQAQASGAANSLLDDLAGWADFAATAIKYVKVEGIFDRAMEVAQIIREVQSGGDLESLGIESSDHRLRNVAEMQGVIEAERGRTEPLAADGLRDANAAFYVLMGNNAGRFDGIDMARYRKIGAMHVDKASAVLPDFEADLFANQTDAATIEFGDSLSAKHRRELFQTYNAGKSLVDKGQLVFDRLGEVGDKVAAWGRDLMKL